jgi:hypothetical protein
MDRWSNMTENKIAAFNHRTWFMSVDERTKTVSAKTVSGPAKGHR